MDALVQANAALLRLLQGQAAIEERLAQLADQQSGMVEQLAQLAQRVSALEDRASAMCSAGMVQLFTASY